MAVQAVTVCSEEARRIFLAAAAGTTPDPEPAVEIFYLEVREATI